MCIRDSRSDLGGALVLSEFTGAAAELRTAYQANPYDLDGVKDAIVAAVEQSQAEGKRRMRALRRQVLTHDVEKWAKSFLDTLTATTETTSSANRGVQLVSSSSDGSFDSESDDGPFDSESAEVQDTAGTDTGSADGSGSDKQ